MYKMPALTHNRVKNGFNGGIRKNNASMGVKASRTQKAVRADSLRKKALVGGIGSSSKHIRAAYKRRAMCSCNAKLDVTKPIIVAVNQVSTPSNDQTPSFDFSSNEVGRITSNYLFTSSTSAVIGNNTITFASLPGGTYNNVFVQVTDANGNISDKLMLDPFIINDIVPPVLEAKTQITTPSNDSTPSFVFTSSEVGSITSSIAFTSTVDAVVGDNTITFNTLADGTYSGVTVQVTDAAGNVSNVLTLDDFTIDTLAPTLTAKTQIVTPTSDTTPSFVFESSEVGIISSSHGFSSSNNAIAGDNTITFNTLPDGTYSGVWVKVTDTAGNESAQLTLDDFTVDANTECLTLNTLVNIVNSTGNKYVFNGGNAYDANKKYGLNNATYTFKVPEAHPMAILNSGNAAIVYAAAANAGAPIIIKVSGGNTIESNGDYYTFEDENNNAINIGNGTFRFMRGKTYKFEANGISSSHPFKVYMSGGFVNDNNGTNTGISGSSDSITITIPVDHSTSSGDLYYQCSVHSGMKKDLSLLYKSVTGSTNDASYDFFYGDIAVTVSGDFGDVSVYCYYHGYMGGENLLKYKTTCTP